MGKRTQVPPFNLWMQVTPDISKPGMDLPISPPVSKAGDHIVLRAEMPCIVCMSCCPNDMTSVNAAFADCHFEVRPA